jgi:hypothetical protein
MDSLGKALITGASSGIGLRAVRSSPCLPLPSRGMPTARRTRLPRAYAAKLSGKYVHRNLTGGVGHNLPQEAPQAFAAAVIDVDAL